MFSDTFVSFFMTRLLTLSNQISSEASPGGNRQAHSKKGKGREVGREVSVKKLDVCVSKHCCSCL